MLLKMNFWCNYTLSQCVSYKSCLLFVKVEIFVSSLPDKIRASNSCVWFLKTLIILILGYDKIQRLIFS